MSTTLFAVFDEYGLAQDSSGDDRGGTDRTLVSGDTNSNGTHERAL